MAEETCPHNYIVLESDWRECSRCGKRYQRWDLPPHMPDAKIEWAYQSKTSRREGLAPTPCSEAHAEDRKALGYVILTRTVTEWKEQDDGQEVR